MPWTAEDDEFISGKKPTARSPWQLFKDSFLSGALHSPAGAEGVVRRGAKLSGKTDEEINAAERRLTEQFQQRSQQDDAAFEDVDTLSPANIGRRAVELFGNILGGADPTYAINPGKSIAQKAGAQGAINAGMDAAAQVIEKRRGVRDKIDPDQIALSGAGGVVLGGGSELIARGARGRGLTLDNAVDVGSKFGRITSTVRSAAKNKKVGGVKNSYHLKGQAIDIARGKGVTHKQIENAYRRAGFDIIESLDEGDHSHLAFNFKKSKGRPGQPVMEDFDFRPPEQRGEGDGFTFRDNDEIDNLDNIIDPSEAPVFDSAYDDFTPYVDRPNTPANSSEDSFELIHFDLNKLKARKEAGELPLYDFAEELKKLKARENKLNGIDDTNIVDARDVATQKQIESNIEAFKKFDAKTQEAFNASLNKKLSIPREDIDKNIELMSPDRVGHLPPEIRERAAQLREQWELIKARKTLGYDDPTQPTFANHPELTPAERQDMDASVPKPEHTPSTPKGLGKGSVATTPVNDLRDLEGLGEGPNLELISNRTGKPPTELYRIMSVDQYEAAKKSGKLTSNEGRVHAGDKPSYGYAEPGNKNVLIRIKGSEGFRPKWTLDKVEAIADEIPFDRIELIAKGTRDQLEAAFNRQSSRSKPPAAPMAPPRPGDEAAMREWEAAGNVSKNKLFGGPDDSRTPTDKLWQALNEARPLNREEKRLRSAERSKRLAKVFAARKTSQGEKGFFKELSQLKGDMPDVDFTSIRDKFTQPEVDHLHDLIKSNPFFTGFDAINAREGLQKMLKGKLPTDSELVLLARAYPKQIIEALKKMRPWKKRVLEQVNNLVNLPRSIMSSFDISFGGRQGIFLIGRKNFWKSYSGTLKRMSSEKEFQAMQREIAARPSYELMKKGGLDLMDLHSLPSEREEAFMSAWGEKLPGVRHSSRAYIGYLNRLRADMFDDLTTKFVSLGHPLDDKLLRDTARYINAATGRGNLGSFSQAATILSNVLFSPRLLASRLSLLNPAFYVSLSGPVRKEAISDLLRFSGAAASVLGLASMVPGVTVSMDTNSSDWGKIKIGNTRLDVMGGFQQYIKLGSQLLTGKKTDSRGETVEFNDPKKFAGTTYATAILDFFRSKFSPSAGYAVDAAHGKNIIGEPFDFKKDSLELFMPLWIQDVIDAVDEHGKVGALAGIPAILGVGVQTYKPRPAKEKKVNKFPSDSFDKKFKKMDLEELDKRFTH